MGGVAFDILNGFKIHIYVNRPDSVNVTELQRSPWEALDCPREKANSLPSHVKSKLALGVWFLIRECSIWRVQLSNKHPSHEHCGQHNLIVTIRSMKNLKNTDYIDFRFRL